MKQAFYANPDVLMKNWGSKHDFLVIAGILGIALVASLVSHILSDTSSAMLLRAGTALGYAGLLFGIFFHLERQVSQTDEFGKNILNHAVARAGLATLLFVIAETMYFQVIDRGSVVIVLALFSPVLFLGLVWKRMRYLARSYQRAQ